MRDSTGCVMTPEPNLEGFSSLAPAVYRASTIIFPTAAAYAARGQLGLDGYSYGLYGTPTTRQLATKINRLTGAKHTLLAPSGQGANAMVIMALLSGGDHVLLPDTAYPAMRTLAKTVLEPGGIAAEFYDPTSLNDLQSRIRAQTRLIWTESPGSSTLEVQDLPAIVAIARDAGVLTGCDNTWASALALKPLRFGVDIVTEGLTKYASGHSDLLLGSISVSDEELAQKIRAYMGCMGIGVSPDDAALTLRGMETMAVRFERSFEGAKRIVDRIIDLPCIEQILWPALPNHAGHSIWRRDFTGAAGVFSVLLAPGASKALDDAFATLKVFAIGASWGGTRSLIAPMTVKDHRTVVPWSREDLILRISIGLEDLEDLQVDIDRFFDALR